MIQQPDDGTLEICLKNVRKQPYKNQSFFASVFWIFFLSRMHDQGNMVQIMTPSGQHLQSTQYGQPQQVIMTPQGQMLITSPAPQQQQKIIVMKTEEGEQQYIIQEPVQQQPQYIIKQSSTPQFGNVVMYKSKKINTWELGKSL